MNKKYYLTYITLIFSLMAFGHGGIPMLISANEIEKIKVSFEDFPHWNYWNKEDGLTANRVNKISVDPWGNLIFFQRNAYIFFDGYTFKELPMTSRKDFLYRNLDDQFWSPNFEGLEIFENGQYTPHSFVNEVPEYNEKFPFLSFRFVSLHRDQFYIASPSTLYFYNANTKQLTPIKHKDETEIESFVGLYTDYKSLWIIGTRGIAQCRVDKQEGNQIVEWKSYLFPKNQSILSSNRPHFISKNEMSIIIEIQDEPLIQTLYHLKNKQLHKIYTGSFSNGQIGHNGGYWIVTRDKSAGRFRFVYHIQNKQYELESNQFTDSYFDLDHGSNYSFYVASQNGIIRFTPPVWQPDESYPLQKKYTRAALIQSSTDQWYLMKDHLAHKSGTQWKAYSIKNELGNIDSRSLFYQKDLDMISILSRKAIEYFDPALKQFHRIYHPSVDERIFIAAYEGLENGNVLYGTRYYRDRYVIELFDGKQTKTLYDFNRSDHSDEILSMVQHPDASVWFSTKNYVYHLEDGKVTTPFEELQAEQGEMRRLFVRKNGNLILSDDEVYEYDGNEVKPIITGHQYDFDDIEYINESQDKSLWFSTNSGVHQYKDGTLIKNSVAEGLNAGGYSSVEFDELAQVYAIGKDGIHVLHPSFDQDPPQTLIDQSQNLSEFTSTSEVRFTVDGIDRWNNTKPERLLYSYRINEDDWSTFSESNSINMDSLSPGNYTLSVRAMDRNWNIDPTPVSYPFRINPPWYLEVSFLIWSMISSALILFFAFFAARNYKRLKFSLVETQRTVQLLERTKERLTSAKAKAEAATKAKDSFLARMSHEMRTPLNGILGNLELVNEDELNNNNQKFIQIARVAANTMLEVIGDVLDFAKIEADKLELEEKPTLLLQLFEETITVMDARANAKCIQLDSHVTAGIPRAIIIDPVRLRQVLINLIGNAVKFTDRGSVHVSMSCTSSGEEQTTIHIEVKDTGVGFDPSHKKELFREFEQDDSSNKTAEGTGLGLAICKRIIEMMGGTLDCESSPKVGSCFWFDVPVQVISENEVEQIHSHNGKRIVQFNLEHPVLIVDDTITNRQLAQNQLYFLGIESETASCGEEALRLISVNTYSFGLIDCSMPVMDGFELTRIIREREHDSLLHFPIIAMTAHVVSGIQERCHEAGMDDYLSKPVSVDDLEKIIRKWLPESVVEVTSGKEIQNNTETQGASDETEIPPIDLEQLKDFTKLSDPSDLLEFLDFALKDLETILKTLEQSIIEEDRKGFVDSSHTLKGVAQSLKADAISSLSNELNIESAHMSWEKAKGFKIHLTEEFNKINQYIKTY